MADTEPVDRHIDTDRFAFWLTIDTTGHATFGGTITHQNAATHLRYIADSIDATSQAAFEAFGDA